MFNLLRFRTYVLDSNSHGPGFTTLRNTWQVVRMGSYAKTWSLYLYDRNGRTRQIMVAFPRWRGPWPSKLKEPGK